MSLIKEQLEDAAKAIGTVSKTAEDIMLRAAQRIDELEGAIEPIARQWKDMGAPVRDYEFKVWAPGNDMALASAVFYDQSLDQGSQKRGGWAPGSYFYVCVDCMKRGEGAKRSVRCFTCSELPLASR